VTEPTPAPPARPRLDDPDTVDQIVAAAIAEVSGRSPTPTAVLDSPDDDQAATGAAATAERPDADPTAERSGDEHEDRVPSPARSALEWVLVLGGAVLVALAIKTFLFQAFYIPSGSMLPTLQIDDRVLVNKVSYDLHDVNRGDLVVFERPGLTDVPTTAGEADDLIKRVIGLPGDTVEVRASVVYVNGAALDEPYLPEGLQFGNAPPVVVPDDHVFVMGDNRPDSRDSRAFGPVPIDDIVGRAFLRIWPPTSVGFL
jgi:signal peptidase I